MIDQATGKDQTRDVILRVNTKAGGLQYVRTRPDRWHTHPDHVEKGRRRKYIDVAALGLISMRERRYIANYFEWDFSFFLEEDFCTDEVIKRYKIGLGDEVIIPGLFLSHIGTTRNLPVLRTGTIAAMRGEPVPTSYGLMDAYLVEMRSVGGISGSPVYTHMAVRPEFIHPGSDIEARLEKAPKHHFLFGLVHGHYTITTQEEWVFKTDQQVGDINAGIAIVVPASKIMETILQPSAFSAEAEMARRYQQERPVKSVPDSAPTKDVRHGRLSLHPLSLETALGAALQTGRAPERKRKKPVDKSR